MHCAQHMTTLKAESPQFGPGPHPRLAWYSAQEAERRSKRARALSNSGMPSEDIAYHPSPFFTHTQTIEGTSKWRIAFRARDWPFAAVRNVE